MRVPGRGTLTVLIVAVVEIWLGYLFWTHLPLGTRPGLLFNDWRVFYAAARVLARGGNPYNSVTLAAAQQLSWTYPPAAAWSGAYANPPAFAFVLEPFVLLPFAVAYVAFSVLSIVTCGAAIVFCSGTLRWRQGLWLSLGTLASVVAAIGFATGQEVALLLAATLGAIGLARHRRWLASGLLMGAFWLKPDILWPAAVVLGIALWPDRRAVLRYGTGLAASTVVLLLPAAGLLPSWLHSLGSFQQSHALSGVLAEILPIPARFHRLEFISIGAVAIGAVAALGLWVMTSSRWRSLDQGSRILWAVAMSLGVWLVLSPFSHLYDLLLLVPLVIPIVGPDGRAVARPLVAACLLALVATPAFAPLSTGLPALVFNPIPNTATLVVLAALWSFRSQTQPVAIPECALTAARREVGKNYSLPS